METVSVLDKGYCRLVDHMGDDRSVVNAARASFAKETLGMRLQDINLIKFLADRKETSPFRHCAMTFEVKAPLLVARQWWKYTVASTHTDDQNGWNEMSRRYVQSEPEFYIPTEWRSAPDNAKQGSGEPVNPADAIHLTTWLAKSVERGLADYNAALAWGIAPEQARLFLPAYAMYTTWRWTTSLAAVAHFLNERLAHKAQREIHEYAVAVKALVSPLYPASIAALVKEN